MTTWTKGTDALEVRWTAGGNDSDEVTEVVVGTVPARIEVDSNFTGTAVRILVKDGAGNWRVLQMDGMDYVLPVSPSVSAVVDPRAVWALGKVAGLKLRSDASEAAGTTAVIHMQARGL